MYSELCHFNERLNNSNKHKKTPSYVVDKCTNFIFWISFIYFTFTIGVVWWWGFLMCTIQYKRVLICSEYYFSCHIFICQKSSDFLLSLDRLFLLLMNRN